MSHSCSLKDVYKRQVVPLFIKQIKEGRPLTLTNPNMTRFLMTLEEAVDLVLFAFNHGESGDIFVQKAPACTIKVLTEALKELFHADNAIKIIGIRHGEKMYETLLTDEECLSLIHILWWIWWKMFLSAFISIM